MPINPSPLEQSTKAVRTYFNTSPLVRIYDPSPDDLKMTLESYLAAGRPLCTERGPLFGSDALAYIRGNGSQTDEESS